MGEALRPHVDKLKLWMTAEDGFGGWLDEFFRENGKYFDDYQEEHQLHYTTLHQNFVSKFEAETNGWLADEGLGEQHLQVMFQLGRYEGDPEVEAMIDTMLNVMEYDKWITHIFELKRRIRARKVVRVKRSTPT